MINKLYGKIAKHFDKSMRENVVIRLLSSWSLLGIILFFTVSGDVTKFDYFENVSFLFCVVIFAAAFIGLTIISHSIKKADVDLIAFSTFSLIYLGVSVMFSENDYLCLGMCFLAILSVTYSVRRFKKYSFEISNKTTVIICISVGLFITILIGTISTLRYKTFSTPNYDFGIFSQMYYYLKTTLLPYTTCERQKFLSHFAVHISPIYYVLLPIYFIFPSPLTLQISQALILGSALIPLFLLCRHFKLSNKVTICIMIAASFYPALAGGTMYDFHENAFLLPLILWFFYWAEKEKNVPMYIFMVLTFLVKEDAAVYLAFIAIYFILSGRKVLHGFAVFFSSVLYFTLAVLLLNHFGEGAMTGRFDNFMIDENLGLASVIIAIFTNPAYLVSECLNEEKLLFIFFMLIPVMFMPLISKKWSQLVLIGPFVLINLMSDYSYQHSIYFQYVYGVMAIFFYLMVMNFSQMKAPFRKYFAPAAAVMSVIVFAYSISPKLNYFHRAYVNKNDYKQICEVLDEIPEDSSVLCSTFFVPYLSQRDEIYEIEYSNINAKYIIIDMRFESGEKMRDKKVDLSKYELSDSRSNLVEVYVKS